MSCPAQAHSSYKTIMSTGSNLLPEVQSETTPRPTIRPASTVGSKFVVAITGAGLSLFVFFHMVGNLQIFLGREVINRYGAFLQENVELLWPARLILLAFLLIHIFLTLKLKLKNRSARPVPYVQKHDQSADLASRSMVLTGLVILAFIIYHLLHFTVGMIYPSAIQHYEMLNPATMHWEVVPGNVAEGVVHRHDVYAMVVASFRQPVVSLAYIIAQIFLGLHLWHGIPSLFQSLGIHRPRWRKCITGFGIAVALIVVIGNIFIPLAIMVDYYAGIGYFAIQ